MTNRSPLTRRRWTIVLAVLLLAGLLSVGLSSGGARSAEEGAPAAARPGEWKLPAAGDVASRSDEELLRLRTRLAHELAPLVSPHGSKLGVFVAGAAEGETLFDHGGDRPFVPASNTKLFTTALAWMMIGPDTEYVTRLLRRGSLSGGTLRGDLVLVGAGDPNLSPRALGGSADGPCRVLATRVVAAGIRRVTGAIRLDDGLFARDGPPPGWTPETRTHWYAAEVGALVLNDACVDITVHPGEKVGDAALIEWVPLGDMIDVLSRATTAAAKTRSLIRFDRRLDGNRIVVSGKVALGSKGQSSPCAIHDPTAMFGAVLLRCLREAGVSVEGGAVRAPGAGSAADLTEITTLRGTVGDAIRAANKRSQNLCAEALFKLLGARLEGEGSWKGGARAVKRAVELAAIGPVTIVDGSGLSYENQIAPRQIVAWLRRVNATATGRAFFDTLPKGGEGTLRRRTALRGDDVAPRLRLKTGTLTGRSGLSGLIETKSGPLFVSILSHGVKARKGVEDRIILAILKATAR